MSAPTEKATKKYRLIRYIKADGSYDLQEDVYFVGRTRVPAAGFFYPGATITYLCDDHPEREMTRDEAGHFCCPICGRKPEE